MSGPGSPPAPPGLTVLYADAELIAVDKPAGLHTAPQGRAGEDTLLGRVLAAFPEIATLPGRKPGEPGLLHRLDRETSGIVLVARTPEAFQRLIQDFAAGRVRQGVPGPLRAGLPAPARAKLCGGEPLRAVRAAAAEGPGGAGRRRAGSRAGQAQGFP